jgi:hypothetical protein
MPCDELLNNGTVGSPSKRSRFSKRYPAGNVSMSLIVGTTKGDSNSLDGEETAFTGEERRLDGALFADAPNWIHFEL